MAVAKRSALLGLVQVCYALLQFALVQHGCEGQETTNCGWPSIRGSGNSGYTLEVNPNEFSGHDIQCKTSIMGYRANRKRELRIVFNKFELLETRYCREDTERLTIFYGDNRNVTWCGNLYPTWFLFTTPAEIIYYSGTNGQGQGLSLEVYTSNPRSSTHVYVTASSSPRLLYSSDYYEPGREPLDRKYSIETRAFAERIHITSRSMSLGPPSTDCDIDYITVVSSDHRYIKRKFCGSSHVDVVLPVSDEVDLSYSLNSTRDQYRGFVLEYRAVLAVRPPREFRAIDFVATDFFTIWQTETEISVDAPDLHKPRVIFVDVSNFWDPTDDDPSIFNVTVTFSSAVEDSILKITLPTDQFHLMNCSDVQVWAGFGDTWYLKGCEDPFNVIYTPGREFKLFVMVDTTIRPFFGGHLDVVFEALPKGSLPTFLSVDQRLSLIWIDEDLARATSPDINTVQLNMSPYDGSCMYFETSTNDMVFTRSSMQGLEDPTSNFGLPVGERMAIHNGPSTKFLDLTLDPDGNPLSSTRVYTVSSKGVLVDILNRVPGQATRGFWLSFRTSRSCDQRREEMFKPSLLTGDSGSWTPPSGFVRPGSYHSWRILNPDGHWLRFKAEVDHPTPAGFNITKVDDSTNSSHVLAFVSGLEGSGLFLYTNATELMVVLDLLWQSDVSALPVKFMYESMGNNPAAFGVATSCSAIMVVAGREVWHASTINYPNFYLTNLVCEWWIVNEAYQDSLFIRFEKLPCYEGNRLELVTSVSPNSTRSLSLCELRQVADFNESSPIQMNLSDTLRFYSDAQRVHPGFQFSYFTRAPSPPPVSGSSESGGAGTIALVGGLIAGAVVACGILVVLVCVWRRGRRSRERQGPAAVPDVHSTRQGNGQSAHFSPPPPPYSADLTNDTSNKEGPTFQEVQSGQHSGTADSRPGI